MAALRNTGLCLSIRQLFSWIPLHLWNFLHPAHQPRHLLAKLRQHSATYSEALNWNQHESESGSVLSNSLQPYGLYSPWNSPGQNTAVGGLSLLQGLFPTQGSNPSLPHCRRIPYQLSHQESPKILQWVAYSFLSESSRPRNWNRVSCIVGGFFINWAIRETLESASSFTNVSQSRLNFYWHQIPSFLHLHMSSI